MGALKDALVALIASALLAFDNTLSSAQDVLSEGLSSWGNILTLSAALRPFCYIIIGICLMIELAQTAAKVDIVKWEYALRLGVKMVLARVCIDIAPVFLEAIYLQSSEWVTLATGAALGGGVYDLGALVNSHVDPLVNAASGLWNILGLFISTFIIIMAVRICGLLVQVIAFGRMFELYVYLAVSPLPCSFFPLGNGDGTGFSRITAKFFRGFAAVCLQGLMMILCLRIFGVLMTNVIIDGAATAAGSSGTVAVSELIYIMLLGSVVLVMSVFKCGSWAKAILDAM